MFKRSVLALLLAVSATAPALAQSDIRAALDTLDWKTAAVAYDLPGSNSVYSLNPGERLVLGKQARRYMALMEGADAWPDVDAVVESQSGPTEGSFILIEYHEIGFLADDDWKDVASDTLLAEIVEATRQTNEVRRANGYPTLEVQGWVQEPYYSKRRNTVYWAIDVRDSRGFALINAVAMKLGRHGFSKLTWAGLREQFQDAKMALGPALRAYNFKEGARYADFRDGDVIAAVGLGAMAMSLMTGNKRAFGGGILAGALVLLKKFWYVLLLPFLALGKLFRRS